MNKTRLHKHVKFVAKKSAKKIGVWQAIRSISREKYTEKVSASLLYGLLSSIAVNFFFQPGHVYSSGATGLAQVLSALSVRTLGFEIPVSWTFYGVTMINDAEGTYNHEKKAVLLTIITREEYTDFKYYMRKADPKAFVSIAENVHILGRFVDLDD